MERALRNRILIVALSVLLVVWVVSGLQPPGDSIDYHPEFLEMLEAGEIAEVTVQGQSVEGVTVDDEPFTTTIPGQLLAGTEGRLEAELREQGVRIVNQPEAGGFLGLAFIWFLPLMIFIAFFIWMQRRAQGQAGPLGQIGKSTAKIHKPHEPTTRFADVAGYREVKEEVEEVVAFLREPDRFRAAGAEVPKGMLLVGPPGTGKTLLARAVAGESGVPFITVTGSDFMEMFVGVGASRVRDLFKTARSHAPCIIFIDELDSIGRKRGAGLGGGHDEREQTLNQLLGEIDGFSGSEGVVIMAATNRPDVLDPALQRPGRFDRQIVVPLPTLPEREEILGVHTRGKPMDDDVDLRTVARGTPGMSGADLKNLINEAALIAVRAGSDTIRMRDIEAARERHTIGRERSSLQLDEDEKVAVAYHEGGHALAAFLESEADPVYKVTVLPTGMALGVTTQLPMDERHIYLKSYLDARLKVMLGGRAAEMVVLGQPTTGGQHDLVQATRLARAIVREYGMGTKLGPVGYGDSQQVFLGEELVRGHEYSDRTAQLIDEEVQEILSTALDEVIAAFTELRPGLDAMAELLVERESLTGEEALEAVRSGLSEADQDRLRGSAVRGTVDEAASGNGRARDREPQRG